MTKHDESFLPAEVEEQIDMLARPENLSQSSNARLLDYLRAIYQEDEEIVNLVWTRLTARAAERRSAPAQPLNAQGRLLHLAEEHSQKGPQLMQSSLNEKPQKRKRLRWLEMLAAVLVVALLVGGMTFLLRSKQSALGSGGPATPASTPSIAASAIPSPVAGNPAGLYVTTNNGIDRIDRATGKVIWHAGSGITGSLLVEGETVIFSGGSEIDAGRSNYYVEAVSAADGHPFWRSAYGTVYNLQGANGVVAVSSCPADSSQTCTIDGLRTSNGQKLWSYPSTQGTIWESYQDGVLYGVSYTDFFALHLSNGTPIWQKTLQAYPGQEANITPYISGEELYFSTCDHTKQTPGYQSCLFFAFSAMSGTELWHKPLSSSGGLSSTIPAVMDGVVYVATFQGTIYAFNATNGVSLWTYPAGGPIINELLASQGVLYAEVQISQTNARLLALKISGAQHASLWSQNVNVVESFENFNSLVLENGVIYQVDANNNLLAFNASNGERAPGYHFSVGTVGSFVFVS